MASFNNARCGLRFLISKSKLVNKSNFNCQLNRLKSTSHGPDVNLNANQICEVSLSQQLPGTIFWSQFESKLNFFFNFRFSQANLCKCQTSGSRDSSDNIE